LTNPGNVRRAATAACAAGLLALAVAVGATAAGSPRGHVAIYFVQGEQLVRVMRPGASPTNAVEQLVAGPTAAEVKHGMRTYVPARTRVRSVAVANGLATVDLGVRFTSGRDEMSLLARLSQLVRTLTGPEGAKRVQLLVDGAKVSGVFPDVRTARPIKFRYLQTPNVAVPTPPQPRLLPPNPHIRDVQLRLIELGYLIDGDADGRLGPVTQNAVLAFQKWERINRTGLLDTRTESRLLTASRPTPLSRGGAGKRAEIVLDRQVALLIDDNEVVRAIAVSSGKPSTPTPPGSYRVYAKITRWWSTPFREWLPWALPFVGGIAFHEFADVPAYPASHGCVRQSFAVARWTYDFAEVGMPVKVITR
jgi:L,D-transpeptidase catalytic domain/Sporulation and spore germination/Putative peptidoglycan binding domain